MSTQTGNIDRAGSDTSEQDDPMLGALQQVEAEYREMQAEVADKDAALAQQEAALAEQNAALAEARQASAELRDELALNQGLLESERRKTRRERARTKEMAAQLREIHAALFSGNIYDLILKACLTLTGATRGLYLTARGNDDNSLRVRAAIGMNEYPALLPSEFIRGLTLRVLHADDESFIYNTPQDFAQFSAPSRPSEQFRNCVTASVVLLRDLDGVVVVADKANGDFDPEDVETLLHVGSQASVTVENARLRRELEMAYFATVGVLADAMEAKDPYTYGHAEMVARHCLRIANHLELSAEERNIVAYAALLHDVGKIGVSDGILNKPGMLLPEERNLMRSHVRIGHDLLQRVPALTRAADILLHHHEWYDGNGYPDGLAGDAIPLLARIVAVVDAYSAMITARSYKGAIPDAEARAELRRCMGTQFDPQVVEAFLSVLDLPVENEELEEAFPDFARLLHEHKHLQAGFEAHGGQEIARA